jgi:hypothetical protein
VNPHTRYEIPVYRVPAAIVLFFAALAVGVLIGTIYLEATQEEPPTWHDLLPKTPKLPDVHSAIQREVDAHNPFLQAMRGGR